MNMNKILTTLLLLFVSATGCFAAIQRHVDWQASLVEGPVAGEATLVLKATVDEGWHIYGLTMPEMDATAGVPDPTSVVFDNPSGYATAGPLTCSIEPVTHSTRS